MLASYESKLVDAAIRCVFAKVQETYLVQFTCESVDSRRSEIALHLYITWP